MLPPQYTPAVTQDLGGGGHPGGREAVGVAVVEEDVRLEGPQHLVLGHAAQEKHLVDSRLPGAQRLEHALMGRTAPGRDQGQPERTVRRVAQDQIGVISGNPFLGQRQDLLDALTRVYPLGRDCPDRQENPEDQWK